MATKLLAFALLLIIGLVTLTSCGASSAEILSQARTIEVSLMRHLPTGMTSWIQGQAAEVATGRSNEEDVRQAALQHVTGNDPDGYGSDALTFLVMMGAVRSLDKKSVDDQKQTEAIGRVGTNIDAIMGTIDKDLSNNSGKDDSDPCACSAYEPILHGLAEALQQSKTWMTVTVREPADVGDLKALRGDLEHMKNTMGGLSEMQGLRLQASVERRSSFMQTISNLMKKASETDASILQNLK